MACPRRRIGQRSTKEPVMEDVVMDDDREVARGKRREHGTEEQQRQRPAAITRGSRNSAPRTAESDFCNGESTSAAMNCTKAPSLAHVHCNRNR